MPVRYAIPGDINETVIHSEYKKNTLATTTTTTTEAAATIKIEKDFSFKN